MTAPGDRSVRDWMTPDPATAPGSTKVPDAYWLMVDKGIRRLLVVDQGELQGILTEKDLQSVFHTTSFTLDPLRMNKLLSEMPIRQLMTKDPVTIQGSTTVLEAAKLMLVHGVSTLPVLEDTRLVGCITDRDLFRVLVEVCTARGDEAGEFPHEID